MMLGISNVHDIEYITMRLIIVYKMRCLPWFSLFITIYVGFDTTKTVREFCA